MPQLLLGKEGDSVVVGAPKRFNLLKAFSEAKEIRLATAFAHMSGWVLIKEQCIKSGAKIKVLTGLDFCQTEPAVLHDLLDAGLRCDLRAKIYTGHNGNNIFHPKVFLVHGNGQSFSLTGSGNLSAGGLDKNVECFVYSSQKAVVEATERWFDSIFDNDHCSCPIAAPDIAEYRKVFIAAQKKLRSVSQRQNSITRKIGKKHQAYIAQMNRAVKAAKAFFSHKGFRQGLSDFEVEIDTFRSLLNIPTFDFDKRGWSEAYKIEALGYIPSINKFKVYQQGQRLKKGLVRLVDEKVDIVERIDSLLVKTCRSHVSYLGMNMVSKILAAHDPKRWPVLNAPVKKTLKSFGYSVPRGLSEGQRYKLFADLMIIFMKRSGAPNMYALDRFFYEYAQKL